MATEALIKDTAAKIGHRAKSTTPDELRRSMNLELAADDGLLAPLTSDMRREIYELKAAYEEFWQQRKFKKGWAKPLFAFNEEVEDLLSRAAEIVVRIRWHFDEISTSTTRVKPSLSKSPREVTSLPTRLPRLRQGRAREYLCNLEQDPCAAPTQFVREIVHATLSNEDVYLEEGLTCDKLEHFIDKVMAYMLQRDQEQARAAVKLMEKLKRRWGKAERLLCEFDALDPAQKTSRCHYQSLKKIIRRVDDISEELGLMLRRREDKQTCEDQVAPEQADQKNVADGEKLEESATKCERSEEQPTTGDSLAQPKEELAVPVSHEELRTEAETQTPEEENILSTFAEAEAEAKAKEETREQLSKEGANEELNATEEVPRVACEEPTSPKMVKEECEETKAEEAKEVKEDAKELKVEEASEVKKEPTEEAAKEVDERDEPKAAQEPVEVASGDGDSPKPDENDTKTDKSMGPTDGEKADQGREDEENQKKIEQEREKAMLKIKTVADNVTRLSDQIEGFAQETTRLNLDELQKEPESAEKVLSKLQKQCLFYSENLMKDLLSLDAISVGTLLDSEEASSEVRPLRKKQVKEIQDLLQDVDEVNSKLKAMLKQIQEEKQRREEQRKKAEIDEQAKQQEGGREEKQTGSATEAQQEEKGLARPDGSEAVRTGNQPRSPTSDELWSKMKLKPKFEMTQTNDAIILQAHIPGMKEQDIEIETNPASQTFTVKGLRMPTPAEETAMRRQLRSQLSRDPWGLYYPRGENEKDLLMRMAAGRYGSFSETFEVSPKMDLNSIRASYSGGVLRVVVPLKHQFKHGGFIPQRRHPHYGYNDLTGPEQAGFFQDDSFWW